MLTTRRSVTMLLTATLVVGATPAGSSSAQTPQACDAAILTLERETDQLGKDVDREVREFVRTEATEAALRGIRNHYKNQPTSEALFDLKDKWERWNEYVEYLKSARATLEDVQQCLNTPGCSLTNLAKRQHEAIARWIQSLGDDGLSAATERVTRAAKLIQSYVDRALNLSTGGALATVLACNAQFEQQAGSAQPGVTVGTSGTRGPTPPPPNPSGMGTGARIALAGAAAAGGVAAGLLLYEPLDPIATTSTTSTSPSPSPTSTPSITSCNHLGNSAGCNIQITISGAGWAETLAGPRRFNVYSVPRGANAMACQLQTTVCFGTGCPGSGVRQLGADLRGLGNLTDATVTIVPIDSGTPGPRSWNVNLTQCAQILRYP